MQKQEHLNTFHKGQIQDVDKLQLSNESYLRSEGGRVIFNEDGTYAWENAKGTKFAFNVSANYGASTAYKPIGGWQINGKLCVFSANETDGHSEIGLVYQPQFGSFSYQTIFNDLYDPYGELLKFSLRNQIRDCQVDVENDKTERVYINDNFNEPRVFNVLLGLTSVSPEFTNGNYNPVAGVYPSFYSVHGMSQMIDLTWGKLKYQNSNIGGNLLSGEYQYAYRYIHQTGYASPWSPLTSHILLSTDQVGGNWTQYQMQQSGSQTNKGIQLELKYIDQRFQQIEVAALFWETQAEPKNAYIFFKGDVNGSTMAIAHQNTGTTITIDELVQRYTEIKRAKTGNQKDNTYHLANFSTFPKLELDTTGITIVPQVRPMLSDETKNEVESALAPPFTNQQPKTNQVTEDLAANLPEVYDIQNDYINYKGTQWCALFKGLFGGEIYPYALVVFDRKGQPFFAQHIADFTPPQRYSNQWTDVRIDANGNQIITTGTTGAAGDYRHTSNTNGTIVIDGNNGAYAPIYNSSTSGDDLWYLNLMGLKFSGIDLSAILYDAEGKLQVSGFSIVRTDRIKQILGQGVIMSACAGRDNDNTKQFVFPCATMFNGYLQTNGYPYTAGYNYETTFYGIVGIAPNDYDDSVAPYLPTQKPRFAYDPSSPQGGGGSLNDSNPIYSARANLATFECPDFLIDSNTLSSRIQGDNMKLIDVCVKSYGTAPASPLLAPAYQAPLNLTHDSFYQKNYRTTLNNLLTADQNNSGTYNQTKIGDAINVDSIYPNINDGQSIFGSFFFNKQVPVQEYITTGLTRYLADQIRPTTLFAFGVNATTGNGTNYLGVLTDDEYGNLSAGCGAYIIANYTRPIGSSAITESLLQNRVYYNTGHFIPVNQNILDTLFAAQGNHIFNDVSVWGGDCFLDYWTYQRLYPHLEQRRGDNQDYAIGLSFPIESVFNIALRQGNTLERFGAEPAATFNSPPGVFQSGVYYLDGDLNKPETFDVNSVLQAKDVTDLYPAQPASFVAIYDYPVREAYTGTKIYGEQYDTYRKFPVNNFKDAEGSKGEINSLQYIFNYLYVLQRNGFARVRFNDRELLTGSTGSSLDVGNALGLQGFDYISSVYGTQHQFSVVNTGKMIHWVDSEKGKHLRFAADGVLSPSDEYGHHTYFTNKLREYWQVKDIGNLIYPDITIQNQKPFYDNPLFAGGIAGVFDFINQSVYYAFTQKLQSEKSGGIVSVGTAETLEYSEKENQYKGFALEKPKLWMNFKEGYFSSDPSTPYKVYVSNEGNRGLIYGAYQNSKVRFVVNPQTTEAKWVDNGSIAINNQAASLKIYSVSAFTENQTTQVVNFPTDTRWRYLQGLVRYPLRGIDAASRLRGKSATVEIEILNDATNTMVRISNHMTDYRISPKL